MKNFIRTLPGKTVLFISCITSVLILTACIAGIYMLTGGLDYGNSDFYTSSEKQMQENLIDQSFMRPMAYSVLWNSTFYYEDDYDVDYQIKDADGNVMISSDDFGSDDRSVYTYVFEVLRSCPYNGVN